MSFHRIPAARRAVAGAAALLTVGLLAGATAPAQAAAGFSLTRVAGANRYETAADLAEAAFDPEATTAAIVASGENFPDALAGSYLAGQLGEGAPIVLTTKDDLPQASRDALDALGVDTVYILGGPAAVSEAVVEDLGEREVVRLGGNTRYDTAAEIATEEIEGAEGIGDLGGEPTVVIASGEGFADALAAGPVAFAGRFPVLLTPPGSLADAAASAIETLEATHAVIAGGTAAVSTAVENELEAMGLTTQRVAGNNRYETAVAVAELGLQSLSFSRSSIDLASGENFPDALAAGPASGLVPRPLVLTAAATLSEATSEFLVEQSDTLTTGRVFGGSAAVSDTAVEQAEAAGGTGDEVGAARIVDFDKGANIYWVAYDNNDDGMYAVSYGEGDTFKVNGATATSGGFETNMTIGDVIEGDAIDESNLDNEGADDPDNAVDGGTHELVNVLSGSFTSGTVGNVAVDADQFDFISPVSGQTFRRNVSYAGKTILVDAGQSNVAGMDANINEGDRLVIESNGAYSLTNEVVEGVATDVIVTTIDGPGDPAAEFKLDDALGDHYASGETQLSDGGTADTHYKADGRPNASNQEFLVNGDDTADYDDFSGSLTNGDVVTYTRENGVQTFGLIDEPITPIEGQAVHNLNPDGNGVVPGTPGGSFALVDDEGVRHSISYGADGTFKVNGTISTEADFEEKYSGGDVISFREADSQTGTEQILELTDTVLRGTVGSVNTGPTTVPDDVHEDTDGSDSYGVHAEKGHHELRQVSFNSNDAFTVNGTTVDMPCFENVLPKGEEGANGAFIIFTENPPATAGGDPANSHALNIAATQVPNPCPPAS